MTKKGDRGPQFEEEYQRLRDQSEHRKRLFFLDRDTIKQYVRHFGWLQVIQDYVERRQNDGVDRPLRYLTLPGPSATDIGLLWCAGLLVRTNDGFPDVVICDEEHADEALTVLGAVDYASKLSFKNAVQEELVPYFPFDVINLDMYGAVITTSPKRRKALSTLIAIRRVFYLQRGQSFLLLLTTSTDDPSAGKYLEDCLLQNFEEDNFREAYCDRYRELSLNPFQQDYRAFVSLVLPKAIGRMARDRGYGMKEHFAAKYDRESHQILCHSFELEPLGRIKPAKKYETRFKNIEWDELNEELSARARELANRAYAEFIPTLVRRELLDVPGVLHTNSEIETELRQEAESLIRWWEPAEPR
jgi:hypothetical protein